MKTDLTLTQLVSDFSAEPWAILPERFAALLNAIARMDAAWSAPEAAARPAPALSGNVAVVPVSGVIFPRGGGLWADLFGGTSAERLTLAVQQAAADTNVSAIVLDVNSPGGSVAGVTEAAAAVRAASAQKPVVAIANHLAASAAYWIAAQAGELWVTPSGEVGSIGVFAAHQDMSKMLEDAGLKVSLISAGKYKVEGNPYEPLTDEARAAIQERVDDYYNAFVRDVAKGRNTSVDAVRGGFGEGRTVGAVAAKREGMVDQVGTLSEAIASAAKLARAAQRGSPRAAEELEYRQRRARARE